MGAILPIKTIRAFQDLEKPARYKIYYGGRGGAKSHSFASSLLAKGLVERKRIVCCREIQKSIDDSVKLVLDDKIKAHGLERFYKSTKNQILGYNGTRFLFAGLRDNISSFKSKEGIDICWIEEAQSVSQESLRLLIPTIRKEDSEIWVSFNPDLETDPIYQKFIVNDPPPNSIIRKVNHDDNPYFPQTLRDEMEWDRKTDIDTYNWIWEGEIRKLTQASVFKNWAIDSFEAPEDAVFYYGADFGFSEDPATLVRCYIDDKEKKLFVDYEAYGVGVELDELPQLYDSMPSARKWKITGDSSRPDTISYLRRQGFKIVSSKKGAGSIEDGLAFLKKYKIIVHPRCKHMIQELKLYAYKIDPKTEEILPIIVDKNNHLVDPLRYSIEALRRSKVFC